MKPETSNNIDSRIKVIFKGAQSEQFELFWPGTKLPLN